MKKFTICYENLVTNAKNNKTIEAASLQSAKIVFEKKYPTLVIVCVYPANKG